MRLPKCKLVHLCMLLRAFSRFPDIPWLLKLCICITFWGLILLIHDCWLRVYDSTVYLKKNVYKIKMRMWRNEGLLQDRCTVYCEELCILIQSISGPDYYWYQQSITYRKIYLLIVIDWQKPRTISNSCLPEHWLYSYKFKNQLKLLVENHPNYSKMAVFIVRNE